jgi:hypothetical protein
MHTVRIVCTADANGNPHGDCHLAEARWNDDAATNLRIVKGGEPWFSTGPEIKETQYESETGYPIECNRCHRGTFLDRNSWRDRIVEALGAGELDVSKDLQQI